MRSGFGYGSGRINSALTTEKIAVFAPMPSASVRAATMVNAGLRNSPRIANRRSCSNIHVVSRVVIYGTSRSRRQCADALRRSTVRGDRIDVGREREEFAGDGSGRMPPRSATRAFANAIMFRRSVLGTKADKSAYRGGSFARAETGGSSGDPGIAQRCFVRASRTTCESR